LSEWVRLGRRLARLLRDHHHPDQRNALLERLRQQVRAFLFAQELGTAMPVSPKRLDQQSEIIRSTAQTAAKK
jgi:hypothetical protein